MYTPMHLTLVAASSFSDAEGFLGPRKHLPTELATTLTNPQQETKVVIRRHGHSGPPEPLYARAWTFQERFLSRRMIVFKRQELK